MISNLELSTSFNDNGLTPLHIASKNGHREVVKYLVERGMSLMVEDRTKNSPLHLAAGHGHLEISLDLLAHHSFSNEEASESERSNLLQLTNASGLSPFGCAIKAPEPHFHVARGLLEFTTGNPADIIPDFSKSQLFSKFDTLPLDKPAKIFVVGDSMAGKSTLVKSLQVGKSAFPRRLIGLIASRLVQNVDEHFGGIITTDFANAKFRRVLFYDLAGHANYFNESLIEPGDHLEHIVFIVVINLKYNAEKAAERLIYWLNFLHYHTLGYCTETSKPSIVVVGSHKDMRRGVWLAGERFNEVYTAALKERPLLSAYFNPLMKPVSFDCRRFEVSDAYQLRNSLQKHCQNLIYPQLKVTSPPSSCYILSQVLYDNKEFPPYLTLHELAQKISELAERPGLTIYKLLPKEPEKIMKMCEALLEHNRLLIFHHPESSSNLDCWIVLDTHALLTEIDKRLTTLKNSTNETVESAEPLIQSHFGIITRERLERTFSPSVSSRRSSTPSVQRVHDPESTTSSTCSLCLDSNLAVDLLLKYKYCEVIKNSDISSCTESFFFPGLLRDEGEPEPWAHGNNYGFAWCVKAMRDEEKVIEFFLPRFLKKLLLCFIESYITPVPIQQETDDTKYRSKSDDTCAVWSRGVSWTTDEDIKVNIELNDDAVILSMCCPQGNELHCLLLRNTIITKIKVEQRKWQPDIATKEFIIPFEEHFPVQTLESHKMIKVQSVKEAILEHKRTVDETDIQSLLYFEPCMLLSKLIEEIQDVLRDLDKELSPENLSEILAKLDDVRPDFIKHFNLSCLHTDTPDQQDVQAKRPGSIDGTSASLLSVVLDNASPASTSDAIVTKKELLEYMDSVSVMDTAEFLQQLKVSYLNVIDY